MVTKETTLLTIDKGKDYHIKLYYGAESGSDNSMQPLASGTKGQRVLSSVRPIARPPMNFWWKIDGREYSTDLTKG